MNPKNFLLPPALLIAISGATSAAAIFNGGFETDPVAGGAGYRVISGWTGSTSGVGTNASGGPFANNGTVPEGTKVGFIQAAGPAVTLTSDAGITGLVPGNTYNLTYRVNTRSGFAEPTMGLVIGGNTVISNKISAVGAVGSTAAYKFISYNFVATSSTMSLSVASSATLDSALLLDAFVVSDSTPKFTTTAWNGDASSGLDNSLTYTHAFNFGGAGNAPNATVNGVAFTGIAGANPALGGSFSYNMSNAFTADTNNVTGNSASLASSFVFGNENATLSLLGLVNGQTYRTSIFSVGFDNTPGRGSTFSANGERLTVDASGLGNNNGTRVDYEFTATGTTQDINLQALSPNGGTFHTYAFANAVVPESSSAALVGIAALALLLRRRI